MVSMNGSRPPRRRKAALRVCADEFEDEFRVIVVVDDIRVVAKTSCEGVVEVDDGEDFGIEGDLGGVAKVDVFGKRRRRVEAGEVVIRPYERGGEELWS